MTSHELLSSREFQSLVARRWRVSLMLTAALFALYYGFILLVATNRTLLAVRVGDATLGILFGIAVLLFSWVLTALYVVWANRHYDPHVERLRQHITPHSSLEGRTGPLADSMEPVQSEGVRSDGILNSGELRG